MLPSRSPSYGKIAVALAVSLLLHAIGGLAWLSSRGDGPTGPVGFDARVDAPTDEFSVTFLDPPKREFVVRSKTRPADKPPAPLPAVVQVPDPPDSGPGTAPPTGPSPAAPESVTPPVRPSRILGGRPPTGTVVFVIDRSSSMGVDGMLGRAVSEAVSAARQLDATTRFQVVAYNGGATPGPGGLKVSGDEARSDTERWLKTLTAEGRSDHRAGVREALTYRPTHIFLLTDADDLEGREAADIKRMLAGPVVLDVIVFGAAGVRPASETPLERLVRSTGGSVRYFGTD
ncbi:MAG TPA: hypothetical protein VM597_26325 [Gemmataceae bacterium]|jgi:hypothetical protein|nr:hypothetical protein [Gemmataceae bacterium]